MATKVEKNLYNSFITGVSKEIPVSDRETKLPVDNDLSIRILRTDCCNEEGPIFKKVTEE